MSKVSEWQVFVLALNYQESFSDKQVRHGGVTLLCRNEVIMDFILACTGFSQSSTLIVVRHCFA